MKKILITSGGTKEYIDEVRVLTNISTGKLGAMIADTFLKKSLFDFPCKIYYVYVKGSEIPKMKYFANNIEYFEVSDVQSVYKIMEELVPEMDVVIHPMAVSDFGFHPTNTKLKSNDPEAFIQSLKDRIYQTPKILAKIKEWNPNCFLISFKFENGLKHEDLIKIAKKSLLDNDCDLVIANDKQEMKILGDHMSYFIRVGTRMDNLSFVCQPIKGKENIANEIFNKIKDLC